MGHKWPTGLEFDIWMHWNIFALKFEKYAKKSALFALSVDLHYIIMSGKIFQAAWFDVVQSNLEVFIFKSSS